ncbi:orotidine 5'-phosphate decarboxylase [Conoideocrella luteorostrata]|uniref:Orotidine 5'-phosphate decarboxylase n=1 Tax=Conoideocrella luteorostrata TaxID=1105319 RepID=A0AAJ0CRP7_9HYPO|nr:orotidine 5'-phosphate decarboxylase [Conoideocrella luteorostrata]
MASQSTKSYAQRGEEHQHPVARKLFNIAESKRSNLVVSADIEDTESLLKCADDLGPYIAVFKTHVDIVRDFSDATIQGLKSLAKKHNFMIFEDRKLIDIGNTVQKQYHSGALRISEWADIVNLSVLGGDGIVDALTQTVTSPDFPFRGQRGFLLLAEMTSRGSLATGAYTSQCVDLARSFPESTFGFVATRALTADHSQRTSSHEDFVIFTTGINIESRGDTLGQQYQTPAEAVRRGADFIIAGRGIYASKDSVVAAKRYRDEGWDAYMERVGNVNL